MAFVRTKTRNDRMYYYLVENYRVDGKVHQRILVYLGTDCDFRATRGRITADKALAHFTREIESERKYAQRCRESIGGRHLESVGLAGKAGGGVRFGTRDVPNSDRYDARIVKQAAWHDRRAARAQYRLDWIREHICSAHE